MTAKLNFVRQQGFRDTSPQACDYQYPALMWQPRAIGILALVGLVLQSWLYFLALFGLLWWNVVLPTLNPLDQKGSGTRDPSRLPKSPGRKRKGTGGKGPCGLLFL